MRVNNINNSSFLGLKGLSQPKTAETFRELSNKYGINFIKMANRAFSEIDDVSGREDVFVRLETRKLDDSKNVFHINSRTDASIYDVNGHEIVNAIIDYPQSLFSLHGLSENLRKLSMGFRENFIPSITLEEEINDTIDRFA